ncbi:MAG: hypothetical protein ACRCX2_33805 [Paraclostridium sp.]
MEELITQFASLGIVGIIGGVFLKKYLEESAEDRRIQLEERKEDRDMYRQSIEKFTSISEEYVNSISKLTIRVENLEESTERIETKIDRILDTTYKSKLKEVKKGEVL